MVDCLISLAEWAHDLAPQDKKTIYQGKMDLFNEE
jgi:hypothetical protein